MGASRDHISSLPDEVLTSILTLLSTKEVVQSSFWAKSWSKIWTFVPDLNFDLAEFLPDCFVDIKERRMECEDIFEEFVNTVLENRGISPLNSIQYSYMIHGKYSGASLRWLDLATVLRPRVVSVLVERENELDCPDSIFSCTSVEKLELNFDTNNRTLVNPNLVNLPSLKLLKLCGVEFNDDFMPKLLSGSPSLQSLYLSVSDFNVNTVCHISSNVLKELTLDQCCHPEQIKISCPSLEYLCIYRDDEMEDFSLENMMSLVNAEFGLCLYYFGVDVNFLRGGLSNVTTLRLMLLSAEFQRILEDDIPHCKTFTNLKILEIQYWSASYKFDLLACFLKHSPCLREIILRLNEPRRHGLEEEPNQEELAVVLFQREDLEIVRILREGTQGVLVNQLINKFHAHIKNIGRILFVD